MTELAARATGIAERLVAARGTVAVAESSTGGLLSAVLLAVPGASAYFRGGGVIYTVQAREGLLGLTKASLEGIRSASEPYAQLLARTVRERLGTTWGLAETGAAGPAGNRYGDAPGHTCIAVAGPVERVITLETGQSDRETNMWLFADAALALLRECLQEAG
ncbi:MAG TPA: CinA family protein [bacterium]|nr:CinA family protein [bacterium]